MITVDRKTRQERRMSKKKSAVKRNMIAMSLRDDAFRQRIVISRKSKGGSKNIYMEIEKSVDRDG